MDAIEKCASDVIIQAKINQCKTFIVTILSISFTIPLPTWVHGICIARVVLLYSRGQAQGKY